MTTENGQIYQGEDRNLWWRCRRKVQYVSLKSAKRAAKRNKKHVYYCDDCGGFHITSRIQTAEEKARTKEAALLKRKKTQGRIVKPWWKKG